MRVESRDLRPRTPIRNLFLTGQDVGTEGIVAGLSGAITTDPVMLRRNLFRTISRAAEHDHHAASRLEAAGGIKVTSSTGIGDNRATARVLQAHVGILR